MNIHVGVEGMILEDHPDSPLGRGESLYGFSVEQDLALVRFQQARYEF